jgi:hypothetical protein
MTKPLSLQAHFIHIAPIIDTFNLILNRIPSNGGQVIGAGRYQDTSLVTITAIPTPGYWFRHWTDVNGNYVSNRNPFQFRISSDTILYANFEPVGYVEVKLYSDPPGASELFGAAVYQVGSQVEIQSVNLYPQCYG